MQNTIQVPDAVYQATQFFGRNEVALIGVLSLALVGLVLTEVIKRSANAKREAKEVEKLTKRAVTLIYLSINSITTTLGFALLFVNQHQSLLTSSGYIGQGILEVSGVGLLLYNLTLNKHFQLWADQINSWGKSKESILDAPLFDPLQPTPSLQPPVAAGDGLED